MKFPCLVLLSAALLLTAQEVQAIQVRGAASCGNWVTYRQQGSASTSFVRGWILGYLSGQAVGKNQDVVTKADPDSMFLWIDNYCRSNPLKDLDDAADRLFLELLKK